MSIFDFIGPIMVGPSSSHTAGALRLARIAMHLLGSVPEKADIYFPIGGSFSTSYKGHGSDKAIIAGLLGMLSNDPNIKESEDIAQKEGIEVIFHQENFSDKVHPNTIKFFLKKQNKEISLQGISIGGGNVLVTDILNFPIEYDGTKDVITVLADDYPGLFVSVLQVLNSESTLDIDIHKAVASQVEKTDEFSDEPTRSYINIELKPRSKPSNELIDRLKLVPGVIGVRFIPKLKFALDLAYSGDDNK